MSYSNPPNGENVKRKKIYFYVGFVLIVMAWFSVVATYLYRSLHTNPLISDEAFIAHFQAHRDEIKEVIRRYQEYEPEEVGQHHLWREQGDTPELLKRTNIKYVDYTAGSPWLPAPYSLETGKKIRALSKKGKGFELWIKHGIITVSFEGSQYWRPSGLYPGWIWKKLYYFPHETRIENGLLLGRLDHIGRNVFRERVLPSLNDYPKDWKRGECVMRKLEPNWFIGMCRSA